MDKNGQVAENHEFYTKLWLLVLNSILKKNFCEAMTLHDASVTSWAQVAKGQYRCSRGPQSQVKVVKVHGGRSTLWLCQNSY